MSGVSFGYGKNAPIISDLDLEIGAGEFVAILGASGCGKSTVLRMMARLLRQSSGTVSINLEAEPKTRPQALVFQDPRLLPWRSVLANIAFGLEGLGLGKSELRRRAVEALGMVGLSDYGERWPYQLSGGQRQRVGLARALAVRPQLLLMDEPFASLDHNTRQGLQELTLKLWRQSGASVVFVTHDVDEAIRLADRVIVFGGAPAKIINSVQIETARPRISDQVENAALGSIIRAMIDESCELANDENNGKTGNYA